MKILVIGACNIDIIGTCEGELLNYESNLGKTTVALGGVAKNIATNLHNLKADVSFLTMIGNDSFAIMQKKVLDEISIDYSNSLIRDCKSSTYLAIHDEQGDLVTAINDMKSFEALTEEDFKEKHEYIDGFDVLVFDTNLSESTLNYLIEKYKDKKIYVDGVSQTKVGRILKVINHIDLLKINHHELKSLLKSDNYDIILGVKQLLDKGLKNCIVSHSSEPITFNVSNQIFQSDPLKAKEIKSTIGAGDALFAGTVYSLVKGETLEEAIEFGKRVALMTLEVFEANNPNIYKLINL